MAAFFFPICAAYVMFGYLNNDVNLVVHLGTFSLEKNVGEIL